MCVCCILVKNPHPSRPLPPAHTTLSMYSVLELLIQTNTRLIRRSADFRAKKLGLLTTTAIRSACSLSHHLTAVAYRQGTFPFFGRHRNNRDTILITCHQLMLANSLCRPPYPQRPSTSFVAHTSVATKPESIPGTNFQSGQSLISRSRIVLNNRKLSPVCAETPILRKSNTDHRYHAAATCAEGSGAVPTSHPQL